MEAILNLVVLTLGYVPVIILLVSAIHHKDANILWKRYGYPAFIIFILIWLYSLYLYANVGKLITWGVVSGILLTAFLDVVRLLGVKVGTMPMDMPLSFGLRMSGLLKELEIKIMQKMMEVQETKKPYQMTMFELANMMKPIILETLKERKTKRKVYILGYFWHFLNGIAFGLTYTLIFGSGHWLIALGWGLLVWILMMIVMPALMNGAKITASIFFTALLAHISMSLPLMWLPPAVISTEAMQSTLLAVLAKIVGI